MSPTTRVAWFHCFSGIAGDMALGSLLDAGADLDEVRALLRRLRLPGWDLSIDTVLRSGIASTKALVRVSPDGVARTLKVITSILEQASLPERVLRRSLEAFVALAHCEATVHKMAIDEVHFHELGAHDTIIDIVGTAAALEVLSIDEIWSSAVAVGTGMLQSAHGTLPNPPPAVVRLLTGVPVIGRDVPLELTTPTGAAIIAAWASGFGPLPQCSITAVGFGAGSRDLDGTPNCVEVVLGNRMLEDLSTHQPGQPLVLLEVNLDDVTGEQLADALSALFVHGAADAWATPVLMKKGRPGYVVSVLCDIALRDQLQTVLLDTSGSFGIRTSTVERFALRRRFEEVEVDGERVRIKVGPGRAKVEHDDAALASRHLGEPIDAIVATALARWRATQSDRGVGF